MVPGWLQTVQRAEYWGVILALQALAPLHLGIDNLNDCNTVGKILDGWSGAPFTSVPMETCLLVSLMWFIFGVVLRFGSVRLRVMLLTLWLLTVGFVGGTRMAMMLPTLQQTLAAPPTW